jgi:hypothetical protein
MALGLTLGTYNKHNYFPFSCVVIFIIFCQKAYEISEGENMNVTCCEKVIGQVHGEPGNDVDVSFISIWEDC